MILRYDWIERCSRIGKTALVTALFTPGIAHADTLVPLSPATLHATVAIIVVEAVALALLWRRSPMIRVPFGSLLWTSAVANTLSSFIRVILCFTPGFIMTLDFSILGLAAAAFAFVISLIIEWLVYMGLRREPHISKLMLLRASFVANSVSYLMLIAFLAGVSIKQNL